MVISKNNYEAFFLDYHEGNLTGEQKREVLAFVASHPELKEEFESFEIISLNIQPSVKFYGKEKLKKNTITEYNYKTWFVAFTENDLGEEDKKQVEQFIEINPAYSHELEILKRTKILPDYLIRFANKSSLKKGGLLIPLWVRVAAAACLVIGLLSYFLIQQKPKREMVNDNKKENKAIVPLDNNKSVLEFKSLAEEKMAPVEQNNLPKKYNRPAIKKSVENNPEKHLANIDSTPAFQKQETIIEQPLAENNQSQSTIIINENENSQPIQKLVVLDDNDLAELGLKQQVHKETKSLLADAVNGVGKLFNVNAHYDKEHNPLQSKYTETLALGPVAITRTVSR